MASIRKVRKAYKRKVGIKQIWVRIKCKKNGISFESFSS